MNLQPSKLVLLGLNVDDGILVEIIELVCFSEEAKLEKRINCVDLVSEDFPRSENRHDWVEGQNLQVLSDGLDWLLVYLLLVKCVGHLEDRDIVIS